MKNKIITIIGGGLSGSLLAVNLLRKGRGLHINLVEKGQDFGPGLAYSTQNPHHLLNIPSGKMSAFPAEPGHFCSWLAAKQLDGSPTGFVSRKIYGNYIRELLSSAAERQQYNTIDLVRDEAVDIILGKETSIVHLKSGRTLDSGRIVLASGNYPPANPDITGREYEQSPRYFRNPWDPVLFDRLQENDAVLIIGTGLTMIDMVLSLYHRGHKGPVTALSPHGYIPLPHQKAGSYPSFYEEIRPCTTTLDLFKTVHHHLRKAQEQGIDWRAVIDSLRPFVQEIWIGLPLAEKRRFLRHLRHLWGVARHRMPEECASVISSLLEKKQFRVLAGRIRSIRGTDILEVEYLCNNGSVKTERAALLVNCTGPESSYSRIQDPLISKMLHKGYICCDELSIGVLATPEGKIISGPGIPAGILFTLGSSLKGVLWESTSAPEIREQAANLAEQLSADSYQ